MEQCYDAWLQRPDDADAFAGTLRMVRKRLGVPIAFGGRIADGTLRLSEFDGSMTRHLHGLLVVPGAGLGGRVLVSARPAAVVNYARSRLITHDYDRPTLAEGIRDVIAAPVMVRGKVRGVIYAGFRGSGELEDRATDALVDVVRQLGAELALRDEVDRRVALVLSGVENRTGTILDVALLEELRDLHSDLRRIARAAGSADIRDRLQTASERLASLATRHDDPVSVPVPRLTRRELDVLGEAALGCSNAEIACRLSLTPGTIKAYLRSATRKLGVHNRREAVVVARRLGLLI